MAIDKFFKDLVQSPASKGALGGAASGALVAMLMSKKARKKLGSTVVTAGGAAAVAGLGYYAYKKWQSHKTPQAQRPANAEPPALHATPAPPPSALPINQSLALKILLAMVAAAGADGRIDPAEMDALLAAMDDARLTSHENAKLTATLNAPPSAEDVAELADDPEQASELYAASLAAIDLDTPAEDLYLRRLARALQLDHSLVQQLHSDAKSL